MAAVANAQSCLITKKIQEKMKMVNALHSTIRSNLVEPLLVSRKWVAEYLQSCRTTCQYIQSGPISINLTKF